MNKIISFNCHWWILNIQWIERWMTCLLDYLFFLVHVLLHFLAFSDFFILLILCYLLTVFIFLTDELTVQSIQLIYKLYTLYISLEEIWKHVKHVKFNLNGDILQAGFQFNYTNPLAGVDTTTKIFIGKIVQLPFLFVLMEKPNKTVKIFGIVKCHPV